MNKISKNEKGFSAVEVLLVLLTLAIIGIAGYFVAKHVDIKKPMSTSTNSTTQDKVLSQTSTETDAQGQDNTSRGLDASSILAAIADFESNNNGETPQASGIGSSPSTLLVCSSDCTSSNSQSVKLSHYTAKEVTYHPFASNLTLTNSETVFIINQAQCGQSASTLAQAVSGGLRQVVVLYDLVNGTSPQQQCIDT